jgi:hypothetical protein
MRFSMLKATPYTVATVAMFLVVVLSFTFRIRYAPVLAAVTPMKGYRLLLVGLFLQLKLFCVYPVRMFLLGLYSVIAMLCHILLPLRMKLVTIK